MCRISALTATDLPRREGAMLFHDLMLRANADAQPDGWGIFASEDGYLVKSGNPYFACRSTWLQHYVEAERAETAGILLGHVRAASPHTARTIKESHPFLFLNDDKTIRFVGAHNGAITGTHHHYTWRAGDPNVDSFRAFTVLDQLLAAGNDLTAGLVDEWMSRFNEDSAFAIGIVHNGRLYLFRNSRRVLHAAAVGNGYLINTSHEILAATADYAEHSLRLAVGKPFVIPDHTLYMFQPGEKEVWSSDLALRLLPVRSVYPASTPATAPAIQPRLPVFVDDDEEEDDHRPVSVTTVGHDRARERLWVEIRNMLNPLRAGLVTLYAACHARAQSIDDDLFDVEGKPTVIPDRYALTIEELAAFRDHVRATPLTSEQRNQINAWNRQVTREHEVDEQVFAFGAVMFWHLPSGLIEAYLAEAKTSS